MPSYPQIQIQIQIPIPVDVFDDPDAPVPAPEVIDDDSEASWALWREATNAPCDWETDTIPMGMWPE